MRTVSFHHGRFERPRRARQKYKEWRHEETDGWCVRGVEGHMESAGASAHRRSKSAVMAMVRRRWALELGFRCRRGTPKAIEIVK